MSLLKTAALRSLFFGVGVGLVLSATAANAQIRVDGGSGPNEFLVIGTLPESGQINTPGDLYVELSLEVGNELHLEKFLFMNRDVTSPSSSDQFIYFADEANQDDEHFGWDDSADAFEMTNNLRLSNPDSPPVRVQAEVEGELQLFSQAPRMVFLIDSDSDDNASVIDHTYTWSNNSLNGSQRAMTLVSVTGDVGDLNIAGTLTENTNFDLAESFWMTEQVRPGTLVAVDPDRPDAVVAADATGAGRLIGAVSTKPGIVMGGGAFSVEALRKAWGDEVAEIYESERPEIEAGILATNEVLRREGESVSSVHAYAAALEERYYREPPTLRDGQDPPIFEASDEGIYRAWESARESYATQLGDVAMRTFFERHFANVALAGRVPVEADTSYGPIRPGDPLTIGDRPGVARRATGPGPTVGTALEPLESGSSQILMLVHRGWTGGGGSDLLALRGELAKRDRTIERLEGRLAELTTLVATMIDLDREPSDSTRAP